MERPEVEQAMKEAGLVSKPVHPQRSASRPTRMARWVGRRLLLLAVLVLILRVTGCMESLFYHPTAGPTPPPAGAELVTFPSRDGTRLCGWFIPAAPNRQASRDSKAPTILHVHGNAGNIADHVWFTEYLPAAGFNVFIFPGRPGRTGGAPRGQAQQRNRNQPKEAPDWNGHTLFLLSTTCLRLEFDKSSMVRSRIER